MRQQPTAFRQQLNAEIEHLRGQCEREHVALVIVLNMSSDIRFESAEYGEIPQQHPGVQFFDVTRDHSRVSLPNYRIVHRLGESNDRQCRDILNAGGEVCALFAEHGTGFLGSRYILQRLPRSFDLAGFEVPVVDGDRCQYWPPQAKTPSVIGFRFRSNSEKLRNQAIEGGIVR